jgi:quercetin dioxygenase-like cupin family protein
MPPDGVIEGRLHELGANVGVSSWANGPGDQYAAHEHGYDKVLVAVRGAITFVLPATGDVIDLAAGDRLDLPAGTSHAATVGAQGVRCLEAHLEVRHLGSGPRRVAGWVFGDAAVRAQHPAETADGTGT